MAEAKKPGRPKKAKVVEQIKKTISKKTSVKEKEDIEFIENEIDVTETITAEQLEKIEQDESVFKQASLHDNKFHPQFQNKEYESLDNALKGKIKEEPKKVTKEELDLIQKQQEIEKYSKAISMRGELKYYPPTNSVIEKETEENLKVQSINLLMSRHNYHYIEAKAQIEIMLKDMTALEVREVITNNQFVRYSTEIKEQPKNIQTGIQIESKEHNIKYY